jgi:hypothetical protein
MRICYVVDHDDDDDLTPFCMNKYTNIESFLYFIAIVWIVSSILRKPLPCLW